MMRTLLARWRGRDLPPSPLPSLPDGQLIYAVGDLHGRADLLSQAAAVIGDDAARTPDVAAVTVFLGDYVDRGPASADIVDRLSQDAFPTPLIALKGNHEAFLLEALQDDAAFVRWCGFGGLETLFSYGCDIRPVQLGQNIPEARAAFAAALPDAHRTWLAGLPLHATFGDYYFCHAGIRPGVALDAQVEADLLWIREAFTDFRRRHERVIVHGHTPVMTADMHPHRINIDTGAYGTGLLTCLRLQGTQQQVISITADGRRGHP